MYLWCSDRACASGYDRRSRTQPNINNGNRSFAVIELSNAGKRPMRTQISTKRNQSVAAKGDNLMVHQSKSSWRRTMLLRLMGAGLSLSVALTPLAGLQAQEQPTADSPIPIGPTIESPEFLFTAANLAGAEADVDELILSEAEETPSALELAGREIAELGAESLLAGPGATEHQESTAALANSVYLPLITGGMGNASAESATVAAAAGAGTKADFNGDGYIDLAIGAPFEGIGNADAAGAVHILYGTAKGLQKTKNQLWHQNSGGIPGNAENPDLFGEALAHGDFNGDGYADLAIGAPGEDSFAGVVHILYGSSGGLKKNKTQLWSQDSAGIPGVAQLNDTFGRALAAGNFNNDGYIDLAIGAPGDSETGGMVTILYGAANGLSSTGAQAFHRNAQPNPAQGGAFGSALASGNFDNSGGDDLAIGVPFINGAAGEVVVLYGLNNSGLSSANKQTWNQNSTNVADTAEAGDYFGATLAVGDFNGNGYDDLAIGVPDEDVLVTPNAGAVHVLYGSASRLTGTGSQFWHQDSPNVPGADLTPNERFGAALAAGDFDGNNYDDLAVGTPGEDHDFLTINDHGIVHIFNGSAGGMTPSPMTWHQDVVNVLDTTESGDSFGASLQSGDFNNDGYVDMAVGIPGEDIGTIDDGGAVQVLYGTSTGIKAAGNQFWHQNSAGIKDAAEINDFFGTLR